MKIAERNARSGEVTVRDATPAEIASIEIEIARDKLAQDAAKLRKNRQQILEEMIDAEIERRQREGKN